VNTRTIRHCRSFALSIAALSVLPPLASGQSEPAKATPQPKLISDQPGGEKPPEAAMIDLQIVQIDATAGQKVKTTWTKAVAIPLPIPSDNGDPDFGVTLIGRNIVVELGDAVLQLKDGRLPPHTNGTAGGENADLGYRVLAAPKLMVSVGEQAAIGIGATVPYMVRRDDGSLVIEESQDIVEGVSIKVIIDKADENIVSLKKLNVRISTVVGRREIPGVPFDVGRPIIHSMETTSALSLGPEHVAVIALPRKKEDDSAIFVFLAARHVNRD